MAAFSVEQLAIMSLYRTGSRATLLLDLAEALPHVDDPEAAAYIIDCVAALNTITDMEFCDISFDSGLL